MKLLILTQKVDKEDAVLGFFHRWIEEFSKRYEFVTVICLEEGRYDLPKNTKILSLGKENNHSRIKYLLKFYKYIWQERKNYDAVFVHMNPEYVVLGGILWRLWRKNIKLWYNHPKGNLWLTVGSIIAHRIFYVSPYAYASQFSNAEKMPAGIDTTHFVKINTVTKEKRGVLSLGRISPVKNIDTIVRALNILAGNKVPFKATLCGNPVGKNLNYLAKVKSLARRAKGDEHIFFCPGISYSKVPEMYNRHEICINATPSGSFDKTILEAMACEVLVLVSNRSFSNVLPETFIFEEENELDLAKKLKNILNLTDSKKVEYGRQFRNYVCSEHDLKILIDKLKMI